MNSPIDCAKPTHQLNDVLFEVKLQDVYSNFQIPKTQTKYAVGSPYYKAVVNQENGQILSVVGSSYRLIPNKVALEMGRELFCRIYPHVKENDLIPYKVVAPESKASAHIDLIHKDVNFKVWEQETWMPFLRVTNSYNRTYALSFEIGFARKLCSNGVLFNKETMKIKYVHSKSGRMDLQKDASAIEQVSGLFKLQCTMLSGYAIPKEMMFALVCQIMKLNLKLPDNNQYKRKINNLQNLYQNVKDLTANYANNGAVNAYTTLNIVSDLVSHQSVYKNLTGFHFNVRSFYARPTDWMEEFTRKIVTNNFNLNEYLKSTTAVLDLIEKELGFKWRMN
jgi:hypothetical protein